MQSFILDRHTDPSNPVMKVTQDDKIPIYDTDADVDADLANLEENQIVFTKDVGMKPNDWKQYISDENELSDWENVTLPGTSETAVSMEYDGYIYGNSYRYTNNQPNFVTFYVNGIEFGSAVNINATYQSNQSLVIPIKKGDVVYAIAEGSTKVFRARFYKKRHYEFR